MSIRRISWKSALAASLAVHATIVGVLAWAGASQTPHGGEGLFTVELGGPAGESGGFGDIQKEGRRGNAGSGGDSAQTHSEKRELQKADEPTQKAAPKTEGENLPEPPKVAKSEAVEAEASTTETAAVTHEDGDVQIKQVAEPPKLQHKKDVKKVTKTPKAQPKTQKKAVSKPAPKPPEQDKAVRSDTDGKDGKAKKVNAGSGGAVGASGSASGKAETVVSGVGSGAGDAFGNGQFVDNGDGTYTALGSGGIAYKIRHEETPVYPREARSIGFNKVVKLRVRFLVGLDGHVESAEVTTKNVPNLGFRESALAAVRQMEFDPIMYKRHNIKVFFRKTIVFQP